MAAISIAILLDFRRAFARIHPFDPGASYGFPMEMDMKNVTLARSTGIVTALFATALAAGPAATAQEKYTPTPANLEARAWFQDAKFGMFIHWGGYSVLGDGEWIMETRPINRTDYAKLPEFFNPIKFDPAAWVALAKAAGMKYITITSKHHDGFAMFDSKLSDWNVVARTPYGKDVIAMLAAECHKQGIKLFLYHSQLDWHSTDYFPRGRTGHHTTGFNPEQSVSVLPLETAETMNNSWGFNLMDENFKSTGDLIRYLVRAAGSNANFLLNVGPMPNGEIQLEFVQRLTEVGRWTKQYGDSIYGTRGGPVAAGPWGVTTQRGSTIYVHVLDWNQPVLALAGLPRPVHSARLLRDGSSAEFSAVKGGLVLKLPEPQPDEVDRVIVLELEATK